ncbi:MAG: 4Fe-4S dicluster domain-containing protein [Beijerinckiaceae bacterium]
MSFDNTTIVLCTCEDTMAPDGKTVARACTGATVRGANHLCRTEAALFTDLAAKPGKLVIGCTQEAPLFQDLAEENSSAAELSFVNIREAAGWSKEGKTAGPKTAALIAAAQVPMPAIKPVTLESQGVALILGRDQTALDAAAKLAGRLDVTVILTSFDGILPPSRAEFPIRQGRARNASGWLGAFEVVIDGFAEPAASSRAGFKVGRGRDGLTSNCDVLIDLTGGQPLFPAPDLRSGYLRADPASPAAVAELLFAAGDLVGTFDKPQYIDFKADLCAHSRSKIKGCTRCLDLCPTGAITPAGDHVAISAEICAGCGACAAACPTGAANYALPKPDALIAKLRTLVSTYRDAGGKDAVVLLHDGQHGWGLIEALARYGDGLPANVLPVEVNEITQVGVEAVAAVFAYGGAAVRFLSRSKPKHDIDGLHRTVDLANRLIATQGFSAIPAAVIETDDPDLLLAALRGISGLKTAKTPSGFLPIGAKRDVMVTALRELHAAAPAPVDVIALDKGAPFGRVQVNTEGCTLCLSCVSACPVSALGDNPDRPMLTFDESLCVQCGLCAATCPEKVITLEPRANFKAFGAKPVVIKQEEPAHCTECGKAFGVKSTIDRVAAKLRDKHWMYAGGNSDRTRVLYMCEDCRVGEMTKGSFDPYAGVAERAPAKTTEDYLREREEMERLRAENRGKPH